MTTPDLNIRTILALHKSIKKWQRNANMWYWFQAKVGVEDCPLCDLFFNPDEAGEACLGCPVSARTGERFCHDTPYDTAADASWARNKAAFRAAARAEVKFLRSLLPGSQI